MPACRYDRASATRLLTTGLLRPGFSFDLWLLFAVLTVYGAAGVVRDAAESALVAAAVDGRLLGDVNGLRVTAAEGMELFAPLAGAGLYAAYGGVGVALLDAATFVVAAGFYAPLRVPGGRQRPGRRAHGPASPSACLASPRPQRPPRAERTCARSSSDASPAW